MSKRLRDGFVGWLPPLPATEKPGYWKCACTYTTHGVVINHKTNIGALVRCPDCGTWRSEGIPA